MLIKQIIGVNELTDPEQVAENECTVLSDMVLDNPVGSPQKRSGWSKFNANTVDSSGDTISIHDVVDSAGNNYLLASITTKLKKSLDGTASFSDVKTGLTSGKKTRIATIPNGVAVCNDSDTPFVLYDSGFSTVVNLEIAAPDVDSIAATLAGSYTDGLEKDKRYRWVLVYYDKDGNQSNVSKPIFFQTIVSTASNSTDYIDSDVLGTGLTDKIWVTFTSVPVSSDSRVVSKKLFRTEGNGAVFYLAKAMLNAETSVVDNVPDAELDTAETIVFYNTPSKFRYITKNSARLFTGYITRKEPNAVSKIAVQLTSVPGQLFRKQSTDGTTGNIADGTYRWKYSFVDKDGIESSLSPHYVSETLEGDLPTTNSIRLQGWSRPAIGSNPDGNPDPDIVAVRLYRTKVGTTIPYYFVKDIPAQPVGVTITFRPFAGESNSGSGYYFTVQDTTADASLGAVYPKEGKSVEDETTYKTGVMFSEINQYRTFREENFLEVFPDDGDEITGITDDVDGVLVFKKYSICKIYTTGSPSNWQLFRLVKEFGCTEPNSLVKNENEYVFVSNNKVYQYQSGGQPVSIGEKFKTTLASVSTWNSAAYHRDREWYVFAVNISSQTFMLIYDRKLQTWYKFSSVRLNAVAPKLYGSNAGEMLTGTGNGSNANYIGYYNTSATVDNTTGSDVQISPTFTTRTYLLGDGIFQGRLRELFLNWDKLSSEGLTITITDPDSGNVNSDTITSGSGVITTRTVIDAWLYKLALLTAKIKISLEGAGLNRLYNLKLNWRQTRRGRGL